nr:MAG TPA: hypothetical protein [Caudoviricetes sp.]
MKFLSFSSPPLESPMLGLLLVWHGAFALWGFC